MKRILAMALSVMLVATLAISGTVAYFTDDESKVNTMTVGSVNIKLHEEQRDLDNQNDPIPGSALEPFENDKNMMPVYGNDSKDSWNLSTNKNYVDKIVRVENTGESDAFVRVFVAIPAELDKEFPVGTEKIKPLHWDYGTDFTDAEHPTSDFETEFGAPVLMDYSPFEIDGIKYNIYCFTRKQPLHAADTEEDMTAAVMVGVYLDELVDYNDKDLSYYLGDKNDPNMKIAYSPDDKINIPVFVQAVQADGFIDETAEDKGASNAFDVAKMPKNPWDGGKMLPDTNEDAENEKLIRTADALKAALEAGGNVKLGADITLESTPEITKDTTIDLNNKKLTVTGERAYGLHVTGSANLNVSNGKMVAQSTNGDVDGTGASTGASSNIYFDSTGKLTVKDVEIAGSVRGGHRAIQVYKGTAEISNVDITTNYGSGVNAGSGASVALADCNITVNGMYKAPYNSTCFSVMSGASMTIDSGNYKMINDNTYSTGDTHGGWVGIVMNSGGTLTLNDGTFTNVPTTGFNSDYERAIIAVERLDETTSTVTFNGGTYTPQKDKVCEGYGVSSYPTVNGTLIDNDTFNHEGGVTYTTK